ncbi:MAG: hypothetical protein AB1555_18940 [Nitrospirota bacterium]
MLGARRTGGLVVLALLASGFAPWGFGLLVGAAAEPSPNDATPHIRPLPDGLTADLFLRSFEKVLAQLTQFARPE